MNLHINPRKQSKLSTESDIDKFVDCIVLKENEGLTIREICEINNIDHMVFYSNIRKKEIQAAVRLKLESIAFIETPKIYRALFEKARNGNIPAIELFMARFEGFRKQESNQVNVNINNPEDEKRRKEEVMAYLQSMDKSNKNTEISVDTVNNDQSVNQGDIHQIKPILEPINDITEDIKDSDNK